MEERLALTMTVDGRLIRGAVRPRHLLSDFLRDGAGATGVHVACGQGVCGACTVVIDGVPVRACLMLAVQADGCRIQTVASLPELEGGLPLGPDGLTRLQAAFREHHALQCGFCTPGVLMTLQAAREQNIWPKTEAEARDLLCGNLCRCTGYQGMVDLILEQPS